MRRDAGAASPEYIAAMLAVAAMVAAVVALGLPALVGNWGGYAVCLLFGGDGCDRPDDTVAAPADPAPEAAPPPPCTVSADDYTDQRTTDWIFDRSVDGSRFVITRMSDGSVVIIDTTYEGDGTVLGGGLEIPLGQHDVGVTATAAGITVVESGRMFVLDADAFEEYSDLMAQIAVDAYMGGGASELNDLLSAGPDELGDVLHGMALKDIIIDQLIEEHVTHDYFRTYDEIEVSLGAGIPIPKTPIVIGGSVGGNAASGTVVAVDRETGAQTLTYELRAGAEMEAFVGAYFVGVSQGVAGDGTYTVTVELDPDGNVTEVSLTARVEAELGGAELGLAHDLLGDSAVIAEASLGSVGMPGDRGALEATFTVPLDGDSGQDVSAFLEDPLTALGSFAEAAAAGGELLVQTYGVDEDSEEIDLALRLLASAGYATEDSHMSYELLQAFSYTPDHGLMNRTDCVG